MPTIDIRYALAGLALALSASVAPAAPPLVAEWTQKAPISPFISDTNPGPRAWTNLTYDPVNARMALFGGSAGSRFVADVWHYDTLTDSWTAIDRPADDCPGTFGFSGPDGRDTQSVVYDAYNHLYWSISGGGHKCTGTRAVQRTAGAGSNTTTVVDPALPGDVPVDYFKDWSVYTASTVVYVTGYDPATRTLRLASPISGFGPGSAYWIKVWTVGGSWFFSPVTHEWQRLEGPHWGFTGPTPEPIYGGNTRAVVYTPVDRGLVLFGGAVNGNTRNDTWFLDSVTKTWVQKQPNSSVSGPTKRSEISGGMVYDSVNDVFILFGGRCDGADPRCPGGKNVLNDTWAYKLSTNTWTQMSPPVSPAARVGHQMSFDAEHGVVVMFGGTTVRDMYATSPTVATTPRDLWIYDYATNTWTDITPSVSPPGRYIGSMTYDPVAHVSVLFGGNEPGITPSGRIWTLKLTDPSNINQLPTAAATVTPGSGTTTTDFVFDGSGSSDPDGSIASYAWSFGDGSTATGMTATHRYNSGGNYTVTLTVTDNRGSTAQRSITVSVVGNDTIPDAFSFAAVSNAPVNTLVASGPVAVSGINVPSPISVSGGEYSVDGGAYTTAAGTVSNGQSVRVRLLSSASYSTLRTATLTIGGVSASFSVTTTGNDTDPNAFSFTAVNNVALSTTVTSATATIGGINAPAPISITGGMYSINNGPFTSDPGTIQNGQGVRVQLVSSANFATTTSAVLTVGSVSGSFNVTTAAEDTVPDAFSFAPVTNAALSTAYVSAGFTVWGINAPTSISITGGEYSVAGGAYTSAPGTVVKGQGVRVRVMSSPNMNTQTSATLTVGTVSAAFNVTTSGLDTTPNPFSFASVTGAAPSTLIASAAITVGGINSATPISVSGGEYSIDGGAYTSAAGSVNNGQTVRLRVLSSAGYLAQTSATVTIGGVSGTFNVTTAAMDTTPNAFS
ncbi:MAG: PKD domain-containing protein, partial [Rhodocyclaceae bacterium]|nr:PKD domain-containing protein [Rhodocyclaceae bacterium]